MRILAVVAIAVALMTAPAHAATFVGNTLAGFRIDPAIGMLTAIGSIPTEKQPRGFAIDPTGPYLFAVGQLSHVELP